MKNYYEILAISPDASMEAIKKSYRKLSKQYHPDLNRGSATAESKFKEISEAYAVLSNDQARRKYDEELQHSFDVGKKTSFKEGQSQKQRSSPEEFNIGDVSRKFEQYFGFDPKRSQKSVRFAGKSQAKNPLDTSHIFEEFFKPKKR